MNFARAIDMLCAIRGWTQQELAKRMRVDGAVVSRLRQSSPSMKTIEKLADVFETPAFLIVMFASPPDDLKALAGNGVAAQVMGRVLIDLLSQSAR